MFYITFILDYKEIRYIWIFDFFYNLNRYPNLNRIREKIIFKGQDCYFYQTF